MIQQCQLNINGFFQKGDHELILKLQIGIFLNINLLSYHYLRTSFQLGFTLRLGAIQLDAMNLKSMDQKNTSRD